MTGLASMALVVSPGALAQTAEPVPPSSIATGADPCDLNHDGTVDQADVLLAVNMTLGLTPCTANIQGSTACNVVVIQRIANAASGGKCLAPTGGALHTVGLNWTASSSGNVVGYNVYRATKPDGPYSKINSSSVRTLSYTDTAVANGQAYYYATTAVDADNLESEYSNQVQAMIPLE